MESNGFIKLHRKLLSWEWYKENAVKSVFLHCLLKASFKDFRFEGRAYKAGQLITSTAHLAEETGLTVQQVRTALKKLNKSGEILQNATNKYTVLTVMKWAFYQSVEYDVNKQITDKQETNNIKTTNGQQYIKNINNIKNVNKGENTAPAREEIIDYTEKEGLDIDPLKFYYHYSANGWNGIYDWKAKAQEWSLNEKKQKPRTEESDSYAAYDIDLYEKMLMNGDLDNVIMPKTGI